MPATNASFISRPVSSAMPKVPSSQSGGDVLRRRAEARDLVVVNGGGAVHRDVRHDAAPHQLDEHGREAGLHDVAAEHDDDAALRGAPRRRSALTTARKSRATRTSGSACEEGAEGTIVAGRLREVARAHLVRAHARRERCARRRDPPRRARVGRAATALGARPRRGWTVRFEVQVEGPESSGRDFICSMMRLSSSESQTSACPFSEKMPFDLMIGWTTIASNSPAGDADALASQHLDRHRVAIGAEVAVEGVRLADGERDGAQEVEERAVVERVAHARLLRLVVLGEDGALGKISKLRSTSRLPSLRSCRKRSELPVRVSIQLS